MTILTGLKDATYLAQFLGKKIAIRVGPNKYELYPHLLAIFSNGGVWVLDKNHEQFVFEWEDCQNPYIILQGDIEVIVK